MLVDILIQDGGVYCAEPAPSSLPDWDNVLRNVEAPEDCNVFHDDFWPGKYAYDEGTGTVYLSGKENPFMIFPPDPIEVLKAELLSSYMAQAELYERTLALEEENLATMGALAWLYEMMIGGV